MLEHLEVRLLSETAKLPTRNLKTDAGIDLFADEDIFIPLGETRKVVTNIAVNVPPGYVGKIEDRSSMAAKGLRTGAGVVDSGFTAGLSIVLHNFSNKDRHQLVNRSDVVDTHVQTTTSVLQPGYLVKQGDKIAQILLYKIELPTVKQVTEFPPTERGSNSFGSSGR